MTWRERIPMCMAFLVALSASTTAHAQNTTYRRSSTDTLRYHEVTLGSIAITLPQGSVALRHKFDSSINLLLNPGESARAWYEALAIEATSEQGVKKPSTADILGQPFTLNIDARGNVKVLTTPTFSKEIDGVSDLRHQFDDFLIRLPAKPLARNLEWSDTSKIGNTDSTGKYSRLTAAVRYRVLSDTTVNGERGVVIMMLQNLTLESGGPLEGQPLNAVSVMTGRDSGTVVFSVSAGRMLARERNGTLSGTLAYTGGAQPFTMKQQYQYQSAITLQKR